LDDGLQHLFDGFLSSLRDGGLNHLLELIAHIQPVTVERKLEYLSEY
jgi:hypothetical protein